MRQRLLLVESESAIVTLVEHVLADVHVDVAATAYTIEDARECIWHGSFDVALMAHRVDGRETFGIADWLGAHDVPTVFLTTRGADFLPPRYRNRPIVEKPFTGRELVFEIARATGTLDAPPELAPEPTELSVAGLAAAMMTLADVETRIARLEILADRYPAPEAIRLLGLLRQSHRLCLTRVDFLRDAIRR